MFKKFVVTLGILMLTGCAGMDFNLGDNPIVNHMLLACGDVPVAEFDECVAAEFDNVGAEGMTVAELIELLRSFQATPEVPEVPVKPAPEVPEVPVE